LITGNEQLLRAHVFDASSLAAVSALASMLGAGAWSEGHDLREDTDAR
jgi:hypothetical protein